MFTFFPIARTGSAYTEWSRIAVNQEARLLRTQLYLYLTLYTLSPAGAHALILRRSGSACLALRSTFSGPWKINRNHAGGHLKAIGLVIGSLTKCNPIYLGACTLHCIKLCSYPLRQHTLLTTYVLRDLPPAARLLLIVITLTVSLQEQLHLMSIGHIDLDSDCQPFFPGFLPRTVPFAPSSSRFCSILPHLQTPASVPAPLRGS